MMATNLDTLTEARRLASRITDSALDTERSRSVSEQLMSELRAAGLFQLMTPASIGGLEAEPRTIVAAIEELSRADAATGWTVMIGQGAGYLAWLDRDVTARIVERHPRPVIVGSMAPFGQAQPVTGKPVLRITGRWPYNSGCRLADLIFGGFRPAEGGGAEGRRSAVLGENHGPFRFALFSPSQVDIQDTWRAAGLRGTGSHHVAVHDVEVPAELTFDPFGPAREPGPLYRLPYMTYLMTALAGFPLGIARRTVDEYLATVKKKPNTELKLLAETPLAQADLGRCEAAVQAARAGVYEAVDTVWAEALQGVPSPRTRALLTGAVQHAMRTAVEVADTALRACGASQLYEQAPLQRCFRDAQAAAQHIAFGLDAQRRVGAALLGLDVPRAFL
jgi:alkylation response protein AidB-like acyl-CoA dehydrogenase